MRLLLIEDDDSIRDVIKRGLEEDRYLVDAVADGATGYHLALKNDYAAIILDIMLPGMDGWQICEEMRRQRVRTPILILTARDAIRDRVRGLELGADDYLPKPFDFEELLARIHALIRRDKAYKAQVMQIAHLKIDTGTRQVSVNGQAIYLTPREYSLLAALATNEGRVLSRETIQYQIWNNDESSSNIVDVHVGILRKKIDADQPVHLIHTIHGQGYMLKRPKSEDASCV